MRGESPVIVEQSSAAVILTLNRPERKNALNPEICELMRTSIAACQDSGLPLVLRSAVAGTFIAGSDVVELRSRTPATTLMRTTARLCQAIAEYPQPTIAAISGYAFGGGLEVALACDLRVIEVGSRLGFPETTLGIIPSAGGLVRLPKLVGWGHALDLILTGRRIAAEEAYRLGLAQRLCEAHELDRAVDELLVALSASSPLARQLAKEAMRVGGDRDRLVDALAQAMCIADEDSQSRMSVFGGDIDDNGAAR